MATLQIIGASWGPQQVTSKVVDLVNRQTSPQSLSVAASVSVFGDTWPGVQKVLVVAYRYSDTGAVRVAIAKEGNNINVNGPQTGDQLLLETDQPSLTVLAAAYGPLDVTSKVQAMINQGTQSLSFTANNQTFGDSWPGNHKTFAIVAAYTGQVPFIDVMMENSTYSLKYRPPLRILSAAWGLSDVTDKVQELVSRRTLSINANNEVLGVDGWPGVEKSLDVVYQYGNQQPQLVITTESQNLSIDYQQRPEYQPPLDPSTLNVIAAAYGRAAVTPKVLSLISSNTLKFTADNSVLGDQWPGNHKVFMLSYSWGPTSVQTLILVENSNVQVSRPRPSVPPFGLVPVSGLVANGDIVAVQSGPGAFLAPGKTGQIIANLSSVGPTTSFTVHAVQDHADQFTLSASGGNVVVGSDGTLFTSSSGPPAQFVASLTTTGTLVLSVIGANKSFVSLRDDGAINAAGSDDLNFNTTFSLMLNPTEVGFKNHRASLGLEDPPDVEVDTALLKVVWDLTGGMFVAIGLGPLINGSQQVQTGVLNLIRSNPTTAAALTTLINLVKANMGKTIAISALLTFATAMWDAGLLWKILRFVLTTLGWYAIGRIAVKILEITLLPELQAAELVVSFAFWAYTTTIDVLAYINGGGAAAMIAIKEAVTMQTFSKKSLDLDSIAAHIDSIAAHLDELTSGKKGMNGISNGMNGVSGMNGANGTNGFNPANGNDDIEEDEEYLKDQLQAIQIRMKLQTLRKRRSHPAQVQV